MLTSVFTALLVCSGVYFTAASRGFAIRRLPRALRSVFGGKGEGEGISVYSALCTDLAATLGTGNIVGVAAAVLTGGPGALVWMVLFSFFSMSTKCAENILAVQYRGRDCDGNPLGGPFSYIRLGLGGRWEWMARLFAFACAAGGALGLGTVIQSNSIGLALANVVGGPSTKNLFLISVGITVPAALVIIGGGRRIARLAEKLIPVMAVCYLAACVLILLRFAGRIPMVVGDALRAAFSFRAAGGAALGHCISVGVRRSVFSNEAGLGTAPIAAGASRGQDPLEQGDAGIVSVFVDTTFLCTLTGLCILVTGAAEGQGLPWTLLQPSGNWDCPCLPERRGCCSAFFYLYSHLPPSSDGIFSQNAPGCSCFRMDGDWGCTVFCIWRRCSSALFWRRKPHGMLLISATPAWRFRISQPCFSCVVRRWRICIEHCKKWPQAGACGQNIVAYRKNQ